MEGDAMRKTCGNCQHFTHEPNTPSRGVCWHSAEFDYYVVRGEHYKGCDDWTERTEISETERKAALWDGIVRCRDCEYFDTRKCKSQWSIVLIGYCFWGKRRENA